MNIKETAQKFNLSESTIYQYCQKQLIYGVTKNKYGHWVIPDEALVPYIIHDKNEWTQEQKLIFILKALNLEKSLTATQLKTRHLAEYFKLLEKTDLIQPIQSDHRDIFARYILTLKGLEFLKSTTTMRKLETRLKDLLSAIKVNVNLL